jgi:DNA-binding transcriptional regulator YiaG
MKGKLMFQFTDMSNSEEQIAQHVLEIRLEMGLTQEQFAAKLGVSFPTVNRWENKTFSSCYSEATKTFIRSEKKEKCFPREYGRN